MPILQSLKQGKRSILGSTEYLRPAEALLKACGKQHFEEVTNVEWNSHVLVETAGRAKSTLAPIGELACCFCLAFANIERALAPKQLETISSLAHCDDLFGFCGSG